LENGAGDEGFEAYTQHHFKTVSSNINILAGPAYWSTIKTLPATMPGNLRPQRVGDEKTRRQRASGVVSLIVASQLT